MSGENSNLQSPLNGFSQSEALPFCCDALRHLSKSYTGNEQNFGNDRCHRMKKSLTRREALKGVATASSGLLLGQGIALSQGTPIELAGRAIEISLTPVSAETVRITLQGIENGQPQAAEQSKRKTPPLDR